MVVRKLQLGIIERVEAVETDVTVIWSEPRSIRPMIVLIVEMEPLEVVVTGGSGDFFL